MKPGGTIRAATGTDAAEIARLSGELGDPAMAEEVRVRLARHLPSPTRLVVGEETRRDGVGRALVSEVETMDRRPGPRGRDRPVERRARRVPPLLGGTP